MEQSFRESDYFQAFVDWSTKILTESLYAGKLYKDIARVVSVSIVYFDLGQGEDYVYEGRTEFRGVHKHDRLDTLGGSPSARDYLTKMAS
jgi:hypothetical protein